MVKKAIFSAVALLASTVFVAGVLFLSELAYRALGYNPNRGAISDVEYFPYADYVVSTQPHGIVLGNSRSPLEATFRTEDGCRAADGAKARFNSRGFRGPEWPGLKMPNETRVLITGGSAAVSFQVGERCTLDAQLKERLAALLPGREITIVNLASGGWKSPQELIAVELYGLDLEPDVVVHFSGFNDSFHPFSAPLDFPFSGTMVRQAFDRYRDWVYGSPAQFLSELRIVDAARVLLSPGPVVADRAEGAAPRAPETAAKPEMGSLGTALHLPLDLNAIARRTDFDPLSRQVVARYLRNEELMARAASTKGAVLISALQPTMYLKKSLGPRERKALDSWYASSVNFTVQNYIRLRQGLADLSAREANMRFLDLSTAFDSRTEDMFDDNVHFWKEGYGIVADRLAPVIADALDHRQTADLLRPAGVVPPERTARP